MVDGRLAPEFLQVLEREPLALSISGYRLGRVDEIHLVPGGEITGFRHDGREQNTERQGLQAASLLIVREVI